MQFDFSKITSEGFLAFLNDHGFTQYIPRNSLQCPFAMYLKHLFPECEVIAVGPLHAAFYSEESSCGNKGCVFHSVVSAEHKHPQWVTTFVNRVDNEGKNVINGWEAARILEDILNPKKPLPTPSELGLVRNKSFKDYLSELYTPTQWKTDQWKELYVEPVSVKPAYYSLNA